VLQKTVSILVVNWNGVEYLPRCLAAIAAQTFTNFEIIVVDNASTDGSVEYLKDHHPDVTLIELDRNLGFAAANNIGAQNAHGKWLALLNNDAFPEPAWLESLINAARKYPEYSFFASRLVLANQPEILDGMGDVYHISGLAWRRYHQFPMDSVLHNYEEIFSPCGAAAFYDREAFLVAGGFDEDFTSYHEDVDLGFRLRLLGHRCLYVPDAVVMHIGSASYGVQSDTQVYHGHRNLVWSYFQNMPGWLFWKYLPAHLIANVIFLVYYSRRGHSNAIWRSKIDALRGLPTALRKRREIQKKRTISPSAVSTVMEHGWLGPYLLGFRARAHNR
jgi:GT2 family glycosyltransferase